MAARIRAFLHFWYDFVIGDDWRNAAAVVVAFTVTWAVSTTTTASWWITPALFVLFLPFALWRTVTSRR